MARLLPANPVDGSAIRVFAPRLQWWNRSMYETPDELDRLQQLLDKSAADAGPHLRSVITKERRLSASELSRRLQGMRLLVVATVTADGRPLASPVDGYFLHGSFHFSSSRNSVRMRHLAARPSVSATHLPGDKLAVTVHGRAKLYNVLDPRHPDLRQAMLDYYRPRQGPAFETWLDREDPIGARIEADRMFTFHLEG
jgi:Pyridoxamine 5'-phosphate oxidase